MHKLIFIVISGLLFASCGGGPTSELGKLGCECLNKAEYQEAKKCFRTSMREYKEKHKDAEFKKVVSDLRADVKQGCPNAKHAAEFLKETEKEE